jgi:hypothetical protein
MEIWPEGTCLLDQLCGDKQQLWRTADFIIKSGLSSECKEDVWRKKHLLCRLYAWEYIK